MNTSTQEKKYANFCAPGERTVSNDKGETLIESGSCC